jgi:polysaccharide export outer membrane protein
MYWVESAAPEETILRIARLSAILGFSLWALALAEPQGISAAIPRSQDAVAAQVTAINKAERAPISDKGKTPIGETAPRPVDASADLDSYKIGIEDELQVSVWREPELSMPVQVRPDGMITLPLVDDLAVVGMTTKELQSILTTKLKPFVNEPQVTVIVRNIRSRKVHLVGQVAKPGPYPLNGRKTVLQLITEAGGLGQFAKGGSIYVMRTVNNRPTRLGFNYKKALSGKADAGDIELMPGDMVVVP